MGSSNIPEIPFNVHDLPPSPQEFQRVIHVLKERNRELAMENCQLKRDRQVVADEVCNETTIISWQQRLAALGEEHVRLLERLIAQPPQQPRHPNFAESEYVSPFRVHQYQPARFSSQADFTLQSNELSNNEKLVTGRNETMIVPQEGDHFLNR
ncbi:hypothetical protein EDB81DRAFT_673193 [Dactylonectria macrodidyma]|uniref:Uncharacterized protein n=1 Tax=Dactylonectria macrodidyma TaxID=307937 RepID=A0A9P9CWJ9_9HYPO|nr:hypothetical protein EDB81DRAFT_673193 [Dactylonectria macrodidyma]